MGDNKFFKTILNHLALCEFVNRIEQMARFLSGFASLITISQTKEIVAALCDIHTRRGRELNVDELIISTIRSCLENQTVDDADLADLLDLIAKTLDADRARVAIAAILDFRWQIPTTNDEFDTDFWKEVEEAKSRPRDYSVTKPVIDRCANFVKFFGKHFNAELCKKMCPAAPNELIEPWQTEPDGIIFSQRVDICIRKRLVQWYVAQVMREGDLYLKTRITDIFSYSDICLGPNFALGVDNHLRFDVLGRVLNLSDDQAYIYLNETCNRSIMRLYADLSDEKRAELIEGYNKWVEDLA